MTKHTQDLIEYTPGSEAAKLIRAVLTKAAPEVRAAIGAFDALDRAMTPAEIKRRLKQGEQ